MCIYAPLIGPSNGCGCGCTHVCVSVIYIIYHIYISYISHNCVTLTVTEEDINLRGGEFDMEGVGAEKKGLQWYNSMYSCVKFSKLFMSKGNLGKSLFQLTFLGHS